MFTKKKKIFFVGAMGSGKTEIAINYSLKWSRFLNQTVGLIDLDMIKPCFRLRNFNEKIINNSVKVITPEGALNFADVPIIPANMESYIIDMTRHAVIDVGGDDLGARLVGRYSGRISQDDIELWYVYNGFRPLSRGADDVIDIMKSIERASNFKITGLIHNSHLMDLTTIDNIENHVYDVNLISKKTGVPIIFHCIKKDLYKSASKRLHGFILFPINLFTLPEWLL